MLNRRTYAAGAIARRGGFVQIAAAALILLSGMASAQTITGTLLGTVTDPSGNVVVGAAVTVTQEGTGERWSASTNTTGAFTLPSLLPGAYTVTVESPGFQKFEKKNNILSANGRLSVGDLQLTIGSVTESVSVTAVGTPVQTASSESSSLLTSRQIDTIAQKGRVLYNYLLLLPGVSTNAGGADAASGFLTLPHAGGLPNTMMTMSIDGLQGEDNGSSQLFQTNVAPDAVEEIKVLMNNYQAEYGRNGGATVNVITKSGARDFHGSLYWFKRHEMFNANSFFNNRSGIRRQIYRFNTKGVSIGGPVMIPRLFNTDRQKLFFFYNFDSNPSTASPATPARTTLSTDRERAGDFSQSLNPGGTLIAVRDPLSSATFPGNIIPASRINRNGLALLNAMPLPNQLNRAITLGVYNNEYLNVVPNERTQHLFRIDYRPTDADSFYFRGTYFKTLSIRSSLATFDWARNSFGVPSKTAVFGWTRLVSATMVNELTAGVKREHEQTRIDDERAFRRTAGFAAGQFHPEINYSDLLPQVSFTGSGLQNTPTFGNFQAGRFPQQESDINFFVHNGFTITRNAHTFKFGIYAEKDRVTTGSGFGTTPMGNFSFNVDTNNPNDSRHPFANAMLGNFTQYSESTARTRPAGTSINIDWYVQDSWKVNRKLTLEIGLRAAFYTPWYHWHGFATGFTLERYDPNKAPVLFRPACAGASPCSGANRVALNPLTGQTTFGALLGGPAFVPGTGDPANGSVLAKDTAYPHGFIENAGEMFQPRFGFAWDVFGNAKTAVRGGLSIQNQLLRYEPQAAGAPLNYTPVFYYGNLNTFLGNSGFLSPSTVTGFDRYGKSPSIYNVSLGVQQNIGFGTVLEAKYVSTLARHLATNPAINTYPYGTRFQPQNIDPTTNTPLNDNYLRPYPGWAQITMRTRDGSSNYHALQVQANRRFARGLQFGVSYAFSKVMDYYGNGSQAGGNTPVAGPTGAAFPVYQNRKVWSYSKSGFDQTHVLTIHYTYSFPQPSRMLPNPVVRQALDNWEISGITSFASGVPNNILLQLQDNADLVGGGDGVRANLVGDPRISRGERGFARLFNPGVFARPLRGDAGNIGSGIVRGPGINNWDVTLFKNFPIRSEQRTLQFRWEFYNLLNNTQFSTMNTVATFNAAGQQTNTQLGQATAARPARIMQVSLRFRF